MDPQVQASFIPKKSLDIAASRSGGSVGLVFLIALLIFFTSLAAAAGSFLYTKYLHTTITSKSNSLALAEGAYDPGVIQDLLRIDSRLTESKKLLTNHIAVSQIFAFLSSQTLEQVSFTNFTYTLNPDGTAKVSADGVADTYATVALQSDQFSGNKLLSNVVFSGITVDDTGKVSFSATAQLDPSLVSYVKSIGSPSVAVPTDNATPPTADITGSSGAGVNSPPIQ